ncbi:DUF2262 domain-containing protein [Fusobacterium pseudoperiodonticum]|nr:DUF2262 domain-containing protein [Fusobacterium pseudoperiodonticum]ATV57989.1 hypothetical protein CTM68_10040 [Fusobacterium pseudoperiodonticum]ATV63643.1 hypothetical protein CTM78_04070 [Fusobacterium pseudoperiodonticum]ATV67389.1 hypothetical protein CTM92_01365 [Fusobacterium pseudoperiodonticum]
MQEQEIIALINSRGAFISENSKTNAELIAYVDCETNELFETSAKIEWEVSDKISLEDIKRFKIYHLKVKDLGENTFLLIDILQKDVKNALLKNTLKECEQNASVTVEEPNLGKFILDKTTKSLHSKLKWLSEKEEIDVYLNIDEDNRINTLKKVGAFFITLEKVFKDKKDWDKKLKTYAAEHLADLATELRKNSKSLFKFLKVWKWYFIGKMKLVSLAVETDGEIVATFDDRKLFLGHKIIVRANVDKNEVSSAIVENFNIEDYKKIEVSISETEIKEDNKEE